MAPVKHVKESHTFSTGVDKPAYVTAVVTLPMTAGFAAAEADAMKSRCRLVSAKGGLCLVRNSAVFLLDPEQIHIEDIPAHVRQRLSAAGLPLAPDTPGLQERALAGALDGSMVIQQDDLEQRPFDPAWLSDQAFLDLVGRADHISYGVEELHL
ncbi:hypothetical protein [Pseudomonas aeruginosa]|uniref:hypothetical protein n=1 Tax=Pseudomonas aeruginosa TaxID=287 RepID=UPI001ADA7191|nr:hypothetical protein [Pseudomonas aeruginosa]MBO8337035.1 hypothetical protein [Pseudomonas aeruginosa]HCF4080920.1 hypothetical protein [Pseudomonas aeruginosa]